MIPCPQCGGETTVSETRDLRIARRPANRRRRFCSATCGAPPFTTYEIMADVAPPGARAQLGAIAVVSRRVLTLMREIGEFAASLDPPDDT